MMKRILTATALVQFATASELPPVDFVRDVRPIFEVHCYDCHSGDQRKSGLRLDVKSLAMKGGDNHGPDILPGNAKDSPLIHFITTDNPDEIMPPKGGPLSDAEIATLTRWIDEGAVWPDGVDTVTLKDPADHWSFKPLRPAPADAKIDSFIDARLAENGLDRSPPADPRTLLRRLHLDLTGLPPTPEDLDAFKAAFAQDREGASRDAVESLLASSRYGERWAQHWLDVVRYADTHGFEVNTERPHAYHYRDYVINAFNADLPYDRFIREQLAGDALGADAATGFLVTASVLLPAQIGKDAPSMRLARQDSLDEIVANIGQTFLGLSVSCARCHDHKFDPITAREYFGMQAFVAGVEYADREVRELRDRRDPLARELERMEGATLAFAGAFRQPDEIRLLLRGDPEQPQDPVPPHVPAALGDLTLDLDAPEQQRRLALADWIASPDNLLTARVMVNRIWQGHFGTGLITSPNDFGNNGTPPSHPALLDWLAAEFVASGWSVKQMHRLIVHSETYRQAAAPRAEGLEKDADNRLLWRFPTRRLEAEAIRDSILEIAGRLNPKRFGPGFDLFDQRGGLSGFNPVESPGGEALRRMIYAHKVRREPEAVFGAFDSPDGGQAVALRGESTTPIQALNLFNSRFTLDQAAALAGRVESEAGEDIENQIRHAYRLVLLREPDPEELTALLPVVNEHGPAVLARALFNTNEFLFMP